jgi:hypothetical protein
MEVTNYSGLFNKEGERIKQSSIVALVDAFLDNNFSLNNCWFRVNS